jgi:hypothetical protein
MKAHISANIDSKSNKKISFYHLFYGDSEFKMINFETINNLGIEFVIKMNKIITWYES